MIKTSKHLPDLNSNRPKTLLCPTCLFHLLAFRIWNTSKGCLCATEEGDGGPAQKSKVWIKVMRQFHSNQLFSITFHTEVNAYNAQWHDLSKGLVWLLTWIKLSPWMKPPLWVSTGSAWEASTRDAKKAARQQMKVVTTNQQITYILSFSELWNMMTESRKHHGNTENHH